MRTEKRRKNGYLLPVVSVCTGRQVRPAPPSCCHCPNIIHTCVPAFPTNNSTVFPSLCCLYTNIDDHIRFTFPPLEMNLVFAQHTLIINDPKATSKKDVQTETGRCPVVLSVNLWESVRIPSRFISALSFQLLSRRINGSRVFPVCWLDKVSTEDEGSFMVH